MCLTLRIAVVHALACTLVCLLLCPNARAQEAAVLPAAVGIAAPVPPAHVKQYFYYAYAEDLQAKWRLRTVIASHPFIKGRYVEQYDSLKNEWLKVVKRETPAFKGAFDIRMSLGLQDLEREWENYNQIAKGKKFAIHEIAFPR
jgi:hypothetical protein